MFIKEIKIKNFKCFGDEETSLEFNIPNGKVGSGLNILIGENNSGKSAVFESIEFLRDGLNKKDPISITNKKSPSSNEGFKVNLTFSGNIKSVIENCSQDNKKQSFIDCVDKTNENNENLRCLRKSKGAKKDIQLYNKRKEEYGNITGIDAPFRKLFELHFMWPHTNPDDETTYKSSTLCGSLLKKILKDFENQDQYIEFQEQFKRIFNNEDSSLRKELEEIENDTKLMLNSSDFSDIGLKFTFDELKSELFFKNMKIKVDDGVETDFNQKGSGLQRAIVLALLQVYAQKLSTHPDQEADKPFFLFIDEPELCLHPQAQIKLLESLMEISKIHQIFITTHSPYFFKNKNIENSGLFIFEKDKKNHKIKVDHLAKGKWKSLFPWSPSFSEINYKAYRLPTNEFHNELYGYLHSKIIDLVKGKEEYKKIKSMRTFDEYLKKEMGVSKFKKYKWSDSEKEEITLCTYIRHKMHHPENRDNIEYSEKELKESIDILIKGLEGLDKIDK